MDRRRHQRLQYRTILNTIRNIEVLSFSLSYCAASLRYLIWPKSVSVVETLLIKSSSFIRTILETALGIERIMSRVVVLTGRSQRAPSELAVMALVDLQTAS